MRDLIFRGPVYGSSGYASAARQFLMALHRDQSYNIMLNPLPWISGFPVSEGKEALLTLKTMEKNQTLDLKQSALLHWTVASEFKGRLGCTKAIGHTVFETDSLLKSFVKGCNTMDAMMVPSAFNREAFQKAGVRVPIYVIPEGVNSARFNPQGRTLDVIPPKFTFLSVAQMIYRKGIDLILKAFLELFAHKNDVQLILRWYVSDGSEKDIQAVKSFIRDFREKELGGIHTGNVFLMTNVPNAHLPALYRSSHVLVAPFRGEGWGLPIIEALSSEVPVIATHWGGVTEYLNPDMAILLDYNLRPIPPKVSAGWLGHHMLKAREEGHQLAEPNYEQLKAAMWEVYNNYFIYKSQALQAREYLLENFQWFHAIPKFHAMMDSILSEEKSL